VPSKRAGTWEPTVGSIYKRGNLYWVKYRDRRTGKSIRRSAGRTRLEALAVLREAGEEASSGILLDSLAEDYLAHLRTRAKSKSVEVAESSARRLLAHFDGRDVRKLTLAQLDSFVQARRRGGIKAVTINGDLITLRAILNHALRVGLLDSLPLRIRLLKAPKKRVLPILSTDDLRKLLGHASEPYYGILFICAHTGFRLRETLHLTWSDVLSDEGKLAVTSKDGWESKTYEER
jgi:integrase